MRKSQPRGFSISSPFLTATLEAQEHVLRNLLRFMGREPKESKKHCFREELLDLVD